MERHDIIALMGELKLAGKQGGWSMRQGSTVVGKVAVRFFCSIAPQTP